MPKKARKRIKFIKNTPSGKRALAGARSGTDRIKNPDGSHSSIRTGSVGVERNGKERQLIIPHVVKGPRGKMRSLTTEQATARALRTGDFATAKSVRVATRRSRKFSERLGKISKRVAKKAAKKR